jgi:protein phosphatase PTC6
LRTTRTTRLTHFFLSKSALVGTIRPPPTLALPKPHHQYRHFRDYFIAHLPNTSLNPDPPPSLPDRATTTVRVPLRSAKHHFGATASRGTRPHNDDAYQAGVIDIPPFSPPSPAPPPSPAIPGQEPSVFYFSVFDGHGGSHASSFLRDYLHQYIEATSALSPVDLTSLQITLLQFWQRTVGGYFRRFRPQFTTDITGLLTTAFLQADLDFITNKPPFFLPPDPHPPPQLSTSGKGNNRFTGGSTASTVLISTSSPQPFWNPNQSSTLVTAHLGDTRALLCRTSDGLAVPLTTNHHPSSPSEVARLRRYATAFVSDSFGEERFGVLANTRAFGDVRQKRLGVSAEPEITVRQVAPGEYSFLVLVSDGVSGVLGDQEIADIVKECRTPGEAARELCDFVDEVGEVGDNATAIVVRLGGWEKRVEGGEGWMGTKRLREWRREEVEEKGGRGRRM